MTFKNTRQHTINKMGSEFASVNWFGLQTDVVNLSYWTYKKDSKSHQKRSNIVHAIIYNRSTDHLRKILRIGWDVKEILNIPDHESCQVGSSASFQKHISLNKRWITRTALHEAARRGWTEGVKMLLHAGAKCMTSDILENPLTLALQNGSCPTDLIDMLLKHGADPNHYGGTLNSPLQVAVHNQHSIHIIDKLLKHGADTNDHDNKLENIPLLQTIFNLYNPDLTESVQLLLEHGADPNVTGTLWYRRDTKEECPLSAALVQEFEVFAALFKTLVCFGGDVNHNVNGTFSLLHRMMFRYTSRTGHHMFLQEQLDLFFLHGGNINMEYGDQGTPLVHAISLNSNSNSVRWLIRHGAYTSPMRVTLLKEHFIPDYHYYCFPETALILLQAGMRVSYGARTKLRNMEKVISTWLQDGSEDDEDIFAEIEGMWDQLEEADDREPQMKLHNFKKFTFPEYWTRQLVDLQEFSDESLYAYPEDISLSPSGLRQCWQYTLDQINRVLEFLSQTQSLQWYCRCCIRENLVSLQPSVVKTLPLPARLKRYIMCHET